MKLGIFSTHPIQYQIPIWRHLDKLSNWDTQVFYFSDQGVGKNRDPGFNQIVTWDIPLLEGYKYTFLAKRPIEEDGAFEIPAFNELMAAQGFDAILLHGYKHKFARQIIRNKKQFGYKVILRGEFSEMKRNAFSWKRYFRKAYLNWFYKHVNHFCPIGMDAISHLKKFGIECRDMTLSPYSVDDQLFESINKNLNKQECRAKLGIKTFEKVFLFSGKLVPRKQPLLFAEAILQVHARNPNIAAIYIGSGPLADNLAGMLKQKLGRKFIAPGFINQSELGPYFKSSDVFVLPSKYDTWGLVVNEAMHVGLPCIVSDMVGSRHDLIESGETGLVFDHTSSESLASCMSQFLNDDKLSEEMGKKAHQRIQGYTIQRTVHGIETALRNIS